MFDEFKFWIINFYKFDWKLDEQTLADRESENVREDSDTPIDCQWDNWRYGECSKTCGGGTQTNIRNKKTIATNGGKECVGKATNTTKCNELPCPGKKYKNIIIDFKKRI